VNQLVHCEQFQKTGLTKSNRHRIPEFQPSQYFGDADGDATTSCIKK
jgi:hypothetical protein